MNFSFPCLLSSYPYHKTCCLCICFNLHFMYIASGFLVFILVVILFIFNILVLQAYLLVFYSSYSCYSNTDCCWELHLSQVVWISVIFTNNFGSDVCPHYMQAWELLNLQWSYKTTLQINDHWNMSVLPVITFGGTKRIISMSAYNVTKIGVYV